VGVREDGLGQGNPFVSYSLGFRVWVGGLGLMGFRV
jgi:hypothetical protein